VAEERRTRFPPDPGAEYTVASFEDVIGRAIKGFLADLLDEGPQTLKQLGIYKQRRQYLEKIIADPKSLPHVDMVLTALIILGRDLVIDWPDLAPSQGEVSLPVRIRVKAVREYERPVGGTEVHLEIPAEAAEHRGNEPFQMSLFATLDFPENVETEILRQTISKKGPNRVELNVGISMRRNGTAGP